MIKNLGIKHMEELLLLLGTLKFSWSSWMTYWITGFRRREKHKGAYSCHTKDPSSSADGTKLILSHAANFILWICPFLNNNDWRGLGCLLEDISPFSALFHILVFFLYGICIDLKSIHVLSKVGLWLVMQSYIMHFWYYYRQWWSHTNYKRSFLNNRF